MIGIYHSRDLDGFTSGAIMKLKYPDIKLIGYDYGDTFDYDLTGESVIMADVSFPMEKMLEISNSVEGRLTWIDHHISAINKYNEFSKDKPSFLTPVLEDGIAACEGTWKYFFPGEKIPLTVRLLGEYDTLRNNDKEWWEDSVLPFQMTMRSICTDPHSFPQHFFHNDNYIFQAIDDGRIILGYQKVVDKQMCLKSSFVCDFQGLRALCLNCGGFSSTNFKGVYDEEKHDIMIPFQYNGRFWNVSLYTTKDDVDCSELAAMYGGGGHKQAAGFQVGDIGSVFNN
jgi:oligoribonuclease NrnB/cAMP/cGMP phosphodiesterase (DHH superfamily)